MFRYINGVRFWQITDRLKPRIERAIKYPRNGRLFILMPVLMGGAVGAFFLLANLYWAKMIFPNEPEGVIVLVMGPMLMFLAGILYVPTIMERRGMLRSAIVEQKWDYPSILLSEKDPIFSTIMPRWLVDRYLKDLSRTEIPPEIHASLKEYRAEALELKGKLKDELDVLDSDDDPRAIDAYYRYLRGLVELARERAPLFSQYLGVIYGLEYFDDEVAHLKKVRDHGIHIRQRLVQVLSEAFQAHADELKALLEK